MSTMHTESFMGFDRLTIDDAFTPENTAIRRAIADNLRTAGYDVVIGAYSAASTANGFTIRADPVSPERAALTFSPIQSSSTSVAAAVRKTLPATGRAVIGGFSLYIPQEFVVVAANPVKVFNVHAAAANVADTVWNVEGGVAGSNTALEVFSISTDLKIRMLTLSQSTRALTPGRMHFLEFRISDGEVRVWLDEVLVLQHLTSLTPESIIFRFLTNSATATASMAGAAGRWAISNFYVLSEDERAPNVRLGATTRVIGVRPSSDVDVDFQRPAGFTSNAQIAAQSIVANPPLSLQAVAVGDQDVYAAAGDISTPNAKLVHAVATKVLVSNLEATAHRARALIRSSTGTERVDPKARELKVVPGAIAGGGRDFWQPAMRPTDNAIFMVGTGESVYKTPPNGVPGSPWSVVTDTGSAVIYRTIAFRADGTGVIGRSDGKIQVIPPGSNAPGPVINPSSTTNANAIAGIVVTPDGAFTMTCIAGGVVMRCEGDPSVPANWVRITIAGIATSVIFLRPVYAPLTNRLVLLTASGGLTRISSDMGKTYFDPGAPARTSASSDRDQMATDGSRFLYLSQFSTSAGTGGYSPDNGTTWVLPSTLTNINGGVISGQITRIVYGDAGTFMALFDTYWLTSTNPSEGFRRTQPPAQFGAGGTQSYPIGACVAYNGDWIFASTKGAQLVYTTQEFDADLPPLAGYKLAYNASTINPDTGAAWTPAEATQAQFGLRITS